MIVTLDPDEVAMAQILGLFRYNVNRAAGVPISRFDPSNQDIDFLGLLAEFAFCKMHNVFPDLTCHPRSKGWDCIVKGKTIDVKASRLPNANLICPRNKNLGDADIYVLAYVREPIVEFVGWCYEVELIREENIRDIGNGGPAYFMARHELHSFEKGEEK